MGILTDDMKRVVREQRLGFVATVCADGTPNLSPKGTTTVWDDDHLAFADIRSPNTVRNLRANPAVEVNVVDPIVRKGYRFKGTAEVVKEGERFEQALQFFDRELNVTRDRIEALVLIRVLEARPLISPAYDTGLSEEHVIERWEGWHSDLRATRETKRAR